MSNVSELLDVQDTITEASILLEALRMACGVLEPSEAGPLMSLSDVIADKLKTAHAAVRSIQGGTA